MFGGRRGANIIGVAELTAGDVWDNIGEVAEKAVEGWSDMISTSGHGP